MGCYLLQCHAKEGVLLSLCAWLYVQTRDLICFVCFYSPSLSLSSLWRILVCIQENPLRLHQRGVEWLWCMPVSPSTIINSNEDVPTHSSLPLRERWFPECQLQHMPITLTSLTRSAQLLSSLPTPASTPLVLSDPLTSFLFTSPLELCSGKGSGICRNISYFHFHFFKVRFIEAAWQSREVVRLQKKKKKSTMLQRVVPPLSWVCVSSVHWIGGWQSGAMHIGNGWLSRG